MNRAAIFTGQSLVDALNVVPPGYGAMVLYWLISMVFHLVCGFAGIVVRIAIALSG